MLLCTLSNNTNYIKLTNDLILNKDFTPYRVLGTRPGLPHANTIPGVPVWPHNSKFYLYAIYFLKKMNVYILICNFQLYKVSTFRDSCQIMS